MNKLEPCLKWLTIVLISLLVMDIATTYVGLHLGLKESNLSLVDEGGKFKHLTFLALKAMTVFGALVILYLRPAKLWSYLLFLLIVIHLAVVGQNFFLIWRLI